jgi:hypothetical protein
VRIRRNKHGAVGVREDGIFFPSKGEHRRYQELKLMNHANAIRSLAVHPRYPIMYEGKKICDVELDFEYYLFVRGRWITIYEDFKGWQTGESKLRHKLFEAFYNEKILITRANSKGG